MYTEYCPCEIYIMLPHLKKRNKRWVTKPRLLHHVWPTSPDASESLLPLSSVLLISSRVRSSTPLVHATRVAFDKWVHHTRRLFALLCQLLSFAPCFSSEAPCFCGDCLLICFGLVSPDCRRFLGLFVGGVDVANSGLSHLLGVGKCSLPRSYHPDRPALRYTNTNRNTRTGHFTAASKRPGWLTVFPLKEFPGWRREAFQHRRARK